MGQITGAKVLGIAIASFGLIIAVNFFMAFKAISTFPGLEVANSYVASQNFDTDRKAQQALGWTVTPRYDAGVITLTFVGPDGAPVTVGDLSVLVGRTTESVDDIRPEFVQTMAGYTAPADLHLGKWMLQVEAYAQDGTLFRQRLSLWIRA